MSLLWILFLCFNNNPKKDKMLNQDQAGDLYLNYLALDNPVHPYFMSKYIDTYCSFCCALLHCLKSYPTFSKLLPDIIPQLPVVSLFCLLPSEASLILRSTQERW